MCDNKKDEVSIPTELLDEILMYCKVCEVLLDKEYGACRPSNEIISDGDMPELFYRLLKIKSE